MITFNYNKNNSAMFTLVFISLIVIFSYSVGNVSAAPGDTIYVSGSSGNDSWDGQSAVWNGTSGPKLSIKNATRTVNTNGTIKVKNGIYIGINNTNIYINKNVTLIGQSQTGTIINAQKSNTIFTVAPNITFTLMNLTLTNASVTGNGGSAINNYNIGGVVTLKNVTISNSASTTAYGGAISNRGTLTFENCIINDNTVTNPYANGGAIYNYMGTVIIKNSKLNNNAAASGNGGAIYNTQGNLTILNSTFTGNTAVNGSAIYYAGSNGNWSIKDSAFIGNVATGNGTIYNYFGNLNVTGSDFKSNSASYGGAVCNGLYSTLNIHFNRFIGNTASYGSDIYCYGGTANAEFNWWGNNNGPAGKIEGLTVSKWLVLTLTTSSSAQVNSNSKVTADLRYDNSGTIHTEGYVPNGILVKFTTTLGTISSTSLTSNGIAQSTLKSSLLGVAGISAKLDNQTLNKSIKIVDTIPPKITSTYPKNKATGISRTSTIKIKFSEKIKASVNWSKIYVKNKYGKKISISKSITGSYLYIKTHKRASYSYYTVYIPYSAVKDYAGNKLAKSYTFKFRTRK